MWSLKFDDFAKDLVGHNIDNYKESLSLRELESDQLFRGHKERWVDDQYKNLIDADHSKITHIF
jgi:hypothetical protein